MEQEQNTSIDALLDIDMELASLEDYLHGEEGRKITKIRGMIQKLQQPQQNSNIDANKFIQEMGLIGVDNMLFTSRKGAKLYYLYELLEKYATQFISEQKPSGVWVKIESEKDNPKEKEVGIISEVQTKDNGITTVELKYMSFLPENGWYPLVENQKVIGYLDETQKPLTDENELWEEIKAEASKVADNPGYDYGIPDWVFFQFINDLKEKYSIQLK